jgi:hypothetical protein
MPVLGKNCGRYPGWQDVGEAPVTIHRRCPRWHKLYDSNSSNPFRCQVIGNPEIFRLGFDPLPTGLPQDLAGIGLFLLILVPVLYFALRGKLTVLVLYGDVDIRDVNLGFRVPGRMREMPKAGSIRFTEPQLEQPLFIRISMTGRK